MTEKRTEFLPFFLKRLFMSQNALSENLEVNLNLIRQRNHTNALMVEKLEGIGDKTNMDLAILYDESMIKKEVSEAIDKKIYSVDK
jgi:hypothetical protein